MQEIKSNKIRGLAIMIIFGLISFYPCVSHCYPDNNLDNNKDKEIINLIKNAPTIDQYPHSTAVFLIFDEKDIVNKDGSAIYILHVMIKILDDKGKAYGEVNLPFNSSRAELKIDFARTIKPDGSVISLSKEDIRELDIYTGFPLYNTMKLKSFSMPSLEPGCIIEYQATLQGKDPFIEGLFTAYFSFPAGVNILRSNLIIDLPVSLNCQYIMKNLDVKPQIHITQNRKIYTWNIENIMIEGVYEPLRPPYNEVCPYILFSTNKAWRDISNWFYSISGNQIEPDENIKKFVNKIVEENKHKKEDIIKALYYFVSNQIRYVSIDISKSEFIPHKASEVFLNRYGDCKDKSALLISMLKSANINAYFALLKTSDRGALEKNISNLGFNHCIVAVPEKEEYILLDPSVDSYKFGYLPWIDQGVELLVVKKDSYEFITSPVLASERNMSESYIDIQIKEDLRLECKEVSFYTGEKEMRSRMIAKYSSEDAIRNNLLQKLHYIYTDVSLENYSFTNPMDFDKKFMLTIDYSVRDYVKKAGNALIFDLPGVEHVNSSLVSSEKRIYSLCFPFLEKDISEISISIPEGYAIKYLPEDVTLDYPFALFIKKTSVNNDEIKIYVEYEFKKLKITPDEYGNFRSFIKRIAKELKKSIVFELRNL